MSYTSQLSTGMYVGLCHYIGTPTEITMRRQVVDIEGLFMNSQHKTNAFLSGSFRDGFRFKSSDKDCMFWFIDIKVITDFSQDGICDISKHSILLMEDTDTAPGFVRLKLVSSRIKVLNVCATRLDDFMYISSSLWKKMFAFQYLKNDPRCHKNVSIHGPCFNNFYENEEYDFAECVKCVYWPQLTNNWIQRCIQHNWPPKTVLADILKNGCHFVPIGSKTSSGENPLEWRLSFSLAEQKLVYSMNHTQFLCYGLLKIFLKKIVNKGKKIHVCVHIS